MSASLTWLDSNPRPLFITSKLLILGSSKSQANAKMPWFSCNCRTHSVSLDSVVDANCSVSPPRVTWMFIHQQDDLQSPFVPVLATFGVGTKSASATAFFASPGLRTSAR
jgi:hypothetical protein